MEGNEKEEIILITSAFTDLVLTIILQTLPYKISLFSGRSH